MQASKPVARPTLFVHRILTFHIGYTVCRRPNLVFENASLAFNVLERTEWLRARRVTAHDFAVRKFAALNTTIRSVPAERHVWMSEWAGGVCAVREELAVDFLFEML